jgi:uncharacterized protein YdeI (BOF family)
MIRIAAVFIAMVALAAGCHRPQGTVLGKNPEGQLRTVIAVIGGDTPQNVTLTGTIVEKCPVAGCWFKLKDRTGIIKVDTKAAGFVVVKVPLETQVTIAGKVLHESDETVVEATGLRY